MKKFFLLLITAIAVILGVGMTAAGAVTFSPTVNESCTGQGTGDACFPDSAEFNGSGHVQRFYSPGGYTVTANYGSKYYDKIVFQGDGNLVDYKSGGRVAWSSGTNGKANPVLALQRDGNIVIYHMDGQGRLDTVYWASGHTYPDPRQVLVFSFGNVVSSECYGAEFQYVDTTWEELTSFPDAYSPC